MDTSATLSPQYDDWWGVDSRKAISHHYKIVFRQGVAIYHIFFGLLRPCYARTRNDGQVWIVSCKALAMREKCVLFRRICDLSRNDKSVRFPSTSRTRNDDSIRPTLSLRDSAKPNRGNLFWRFANHTRFTHFKRSYALPFVIASECNERSNPKKINKSKNNYIDLIKVSDSHKICKSIKWIATNLLTQILAMTKSVDCFGESQCYKS